VYVQPSGNGSTASATFYYASGSATDYQTVTVGCGTQTPLTARVIVYNVTIGVRRTGAVLTNGQSAPYGPCAWVAGWPGGGAPTAEHTADVQVTASCQDGSGVFGVTIPQPVITGGSGFSADASAPTAHDATVVLAGGGVTDTHGVVTGTFTASDIAPDAPGTQTVSIAVPSGSSPSASIQQVWADGSAGNWPDSDSAFYYGSDFTITFRPQFADPTLTPSPEVPITDIRWASQWFRPTSWCWTTGQGSSRLQPTVQTRYSEPS